MYIYITDILSHSYVRDMYMYTYMYVFVFIYICLHMYMNILIYRVICHLMGQ